MTCLRRLTLAFLQICGLVVTLVTLTPLTAWWGRCMAGPWSEPRGGVLVVLAGAEAADGYMGLDTYWRCIYAVRAWRAARFERVYVSGGSFHHTPLASQMKQMLVLHGIPADRIVEEPRSLSTRENAVFLQPMLAGERLSKLLITSDLHMFRARRTLARAGVGGVESRSAPDAIKRAGQWHQRWGVFVDLIVETTKIGYYFARRWI